MQDTYAGTYEGKLSDFYSETDNDWANVIGSYRMEVRRITPTFMVYAAVAVNPDGEEDTLERNLMTMNVDGFLEAVDDGRLISVN